MTPRVFFSFRSPFSWMAIERLQRAIPDVHEVFELIPYWEPDAKTEAALAARGAAFHYVRMSKAKHLYILHDVKRLAHAMGLRLAWPVDAAPWWEPSHLGWLKARRFGRGAAFYAAIVAARWQRGENISNPAVVKAAAAAAFLDPEVIGRAVDDPEIRAEAVACLAEAYERDIFGVPFFSLGRERFWGFDRVNAFLHAAAVQAAVAAGPSDTVRFAALDPLDGVPAGVREAIGAYDTDSAGGCG